MRACKAWASMPAASPRPDPRSSERSSSSACGEGGGGRIRGWGDERCDWKGDRRPHARPGRAFRRRDAEYGGEQLVCRRLELKAVQPQQRAQARRRHAFVAVEEGVAAHKSEGEPHRLLGDRRMDVHRRVVGCHLLCGRTPPTARFPPSHDVSGICSACDFVIAIACLMLSRHEGRHCAQGDGGRCCRMRWRWPWRLLHRVPPLLPSPQTS